MNELLSSEKNYDRNQKAEVVENCLLLANALLLAFQTMSCFPNAERIVGSAVIMLPILIFILHAYREYYLWEGSERKQRKRLLLDAFSCHDSGGYYTNNESYSLRRYWLNEYESLVYSYCEATEMQRNQLLLTGALVILSVAFISMALVNGDAQPLAGCALQTVLLGGFLASAARFLFFQHKLSDLVAQFKEHELLKDGNDEQLLGDCLEYECLKSFCRVQLSSGAYNKLKSNIEDEWQQTMTRIS